MAGKGGEGMNGEGELGLSVFLRTHALDVSFPRGGAWGRCKHLWDFLYEDLELETYIQFPHKRRSFSVWGKG